MRDADEFEDAKFESVVAAAGKSLELSCYGLMKGTTMWSTGDSSEVFQVESFVGRTIFY